MPQRPGLDRTLLSSGPSRSSVVAFPSQELLDLPERVVQFGTGGFHRGFIDYFIDAANRQGKFGGRIVAVSSTGSGRVDSLNDQNGLYTLVTEGLENGRATREFRLVSSLSRAVDAVEQWDEVLELARNPDLELVVSNTTEVGIEDDPDDVPGTPPGSFPGKLTLFLAERALAFELSRDAGLTVVPCELIDHNADRLRSLVLGLARRWNLGAGVIGWIERNVIFCNSLVDRIVPGTPSGERLQAFEDLLGYRDEMLTVCEPYHLFAIEVRGESPEELRFAEADLGVVLAGDIEPYRLRKMRLLNGAHTLLAPLALQCGVSTVHEAVSDDLIGAFLRRTMYDELVRSLDVPGAGTFAREVVERFSNPFLAHPLFAITLHGTTKLRVRVVPSIVEFTEREGRAPDLIAFGFAAYLLFLRGELHEERRTAGLPVPADEQGMRIQDLWNGKRTPEAVALEACRMEDLWGVDLTRLSDFAQRVASHLTNIERGGVRSPLGQLLFRAVAPG